MGRVFEKRKYKMFARFAKMSKAFTKYGKEISIAVKLGGPDPENNARLRMIITNAKASNMPKANIDGAISRAISRQDKDMEEVLYEAKGPYNVAMMIETTTDNPTRTVANLRSYLKKYDGNLLTSGALDFLFERKGIFKIAAGKILLDEFELEMIDFGLEDVDTDEDGNYLLSVPFTEFGHMQRALEEKGIEILTAELQRFPTNTTVDLDDEQMAEFNKLMDVVEDDDDVTNVFTNLA